MNRAFRATRDVLTSDQLRELIDSLSRYRLAQLPTPLEFCERLTETLGGPKIFMKRDDLTGLAFGGNKTRQLEFIFPEILRTEADIIVAGAYTQSNWCRQITAAARKLNIDVSLLFVHGEKGTEKQGNLLLDHIMGARIEMVDARDIQDLPPFLYDRARELRARGRRPYVMDPFDLSLQARSAIGYVNAALELYRQTDELGVEVDRVYLSGANVTPAGFILGARLLGKLSHVHSISPVRWRESRSLDIGRIVSRATDLLGLSIRFDAEAVCDTDEYVGPGYGIVTEESRDALRRVAHCEGIFLDPVYTSKAMAALISHINSGEIQPKENIVFIHTGGTPALFAYRDELLNEQ